MPYLPPLDTMTGFLDRHRSFEPLAPILSQFFTFLSVVDQIDAAIGDLVYWDSDAVSRSLATSNETLAYGVIYDTFESTVVIQKAGSAEVFWESRLSPPSRGDWAYLSDTLSGAATATAPSSDNTTLVFDQFIGIVQGYNYATGKAIIDLRIAGPDGIMGVPFGI